MSDFANLRQQCDGSHVFSRCGECSVWSGLRNKDDVAKLQPGHDLLEAPPGVNDAGQYFKRSGVSRAVALVEKAGIADALQQVDRGAIMTARFAAFRIVY